MITKVNTHPLVVWSVKWLMLAVAFAWLVGCSTMTKSMQDPFLSSTNPDEFSCGESHKASARSSRKANASQQASKQPGYPPMGAYPPVDGAYARSAQANRAGSMQYGMQVSSGMNPSMPGQMSGEYGAARPPAKTASTKKKAKGDFEDPFATEEFAASEETGRASL
ncbi:hypothetical protein Plim_3320 [Planctopirus limnophila DSM 3776]|uniref:Lipoprotein n=1 Tax=Planctopirus limnophila (strain ATCC 43296 / DSM 3776 / IFAM 1008 / Mu 290) TaxID=521674 RepID=D5SU80_PLAL2|nr:hypothetical protein [Planctopirus limnophila]ADG69133.1 hypothetical protein Plim_3320 [Planctopirus limnophila DSM 3776]